MDQLLHLVYVLGVLLLVLPAFLATNSKLKQFLTNLTVDYYSFDYFNDYLFI